MTMMIHMENFYVMLIVHYILMEVAIRIVEHKKNDNSNGSDL